jgi:hypothetical protein
MAEPTAPVRAGEHEERQGVGKRIRASRHPARVGRSARDRKKPRFCGAFCLIMGSSARSRTSPATHLVLLRSCNTHGFRTGYKIRAQKTSTWRRKNAPQRPLSLQAARSRVSLTSGPAARAHPGQLPAENFKSPRTPRARPLGTPGLRVLTAAAPPIFKKPFLWCSPGPLQKRLQGLSRASPEAPPAASGRDSCSSPSSCGSACSGHGRGRPVAGRTYLDPVGNCSASGATSSWTRFGRHCH